MSDLKQQTLAQIVTSNYRTAAVLERYQLDFCCKGKRSLEKACNEKELSLTDVMKELDLITQQGNSYSPGFEQKSLTQLADHIVIFHHQYVRNEMPSITHYLQKIVAKHGDRHPEMKQVFLIFTRLQQELEDHLLKEEQILFPRIRRIESDLQDGQNASCTPAYLKAPILAMEHEHDAAGEAMATIRELTGNYSLPHDACTTYKLSFAALQAFEADLHRHVHLENNVLFPGVLNLLQAYTE